VKKQHVAQLKNCARLYREQQTGSADFATAQTESFKLRRAVIIQRETEDGRKIPRPDSARWSLKGLPFTETCEKFPYLLVKSVVYVHFINWH